MERLGEVEGVPFGVSEASDSPLHRIEAPGAPKTDMQLHLIQM